MVLILSAWTKLLIVLCSLGIVAITALVVICFINPFCLYRRFFSNDRLSIRAPDKKSKKYNYGNLEKSIPVELTKLNAVPQYTYGSPVAPYTSIHEYSVKSPTTVYGKRFYTTDSCYSSMSPTMEGGSRPTSPTPSSMVDDMDTSSISTHSVVESELSVSYGCLSVNLKYNFSEESSIGRLILNLQEARNLPGREYQLNSCDPFVRVVLLKTRTKLRKSRSHYLSLSEFQSSTVRKTKNPNFNQSFTIELTKTDVKDCALRFLVFDRDKFVNPSQLAEAMCPLMDLKLQNLGNEIPLTLELQEPTQNNGEILIGLNYLPTSERLSINFIRAMNLKYENVTTTVESLNTEARALLVVNGKLIKKKKTPTISGTNSPNFNYSLSFDIPASDLNQIVFILGIAHRADAVVESDDSLLGKSSKHDSFIGKVFFGTEINSQSKSHWQAMLSSPRQQVSSWHNLR